MYALVATEEALIQSKLLEKAGEQENISHGDKDRIGVAVGMGMLDLQDIQEVGSILEGKGYSRVSPYFIPRILPNLAAGQISIRYGLGVSYHLHQLECGLM